MSKKLTEEMNNELIDLETKFKNSTITKTELKRLVELNLLLED